MTNEHNNAAQTDWRELCRRLYVELWHCNKQMTGGPRPRWTQGSTVRDVLRDASLALEATPAAAAAPAEPFGYFRAEPFGWTDCAATDEGAIALYEHPAHEKHWTENEPVRLPSARTDRVYLAGPMTGIAELNFPAFNQEAERLRAEGLQVLNPADHGIVDGADWADYLRHDIAGLASCERIHLLRGWTKSKGACLEMTIAKALRMTVTYQVDAEMEHNNAPAVPQGEPVAYIETITGRLCAPLDEHRLKFPMCYEPLCKQGTAPAQEPMQSFTVPDDLPGMWEHSDLTGGETDCAKPAQEVGLTDEQKTWAVNQLMEQAQVFASAWSLVGGRHDFGNALEEAEQAKTELRSMVVAALRAKGTV